MPEIRKRFFDRSVWIPLREGRNLLREGKHGFLGYKEEYFGVHTIMVPLAEKSKAEKLEWTDLSMSGSGGGCVVNGEYIPAQIYIDHGGTLRAERLVVESSGSSIECSEWHICPDLVVTLNLKREGDKWVAIHRGYEEVIIAERNEKGCVVSMLIKASYLKDYLCARKMALYATSYRSRTQVIEKSTEMKWSDPQIEKTVTDRWEGRITEIHEGGNPYGSGFAVLHVSRTDVDYDEDIPKFEFATDETSTFKRTEGKFIGRKLYRVEGELWRKEWVEPAIQSQIVCDEEVDPTCFFITDNSGKTESKTTLIDTSRWLWFRPSIVNDVLRVRGSSLDWYTRDTGNIACSPSYGVHFGINKLGLVNVFAKDIALLPEWQQKIWVGHNIAPDGKVSAELLMSKMEAKPASTQAPEAFIGKGIETLNILSTKKYGVRLITEHTEADQIIARSHRFRATSKEGLFELAKDLHRLVGERVDISAIKKILKPINDEASGSLKSLERLLALEVGDSLAYKIMGPFHGVYTLRNSDSHLPSGELQAAYKLCGIDENQPLVIQGLEMIDTYVSALYTVCKVLKPRTQNTN
jgi:hypothetical protein